MSKVMDYEVRQRPIGERINFRLVLIVAVFSLLVGWPVYSFVRAQISHGIQKNGNRLDVDLKSLGNFAFNDMTGTIEDVPPDFRALNGKQVALEGFMYAGSNAADHVNRFEFVYNIQKCCFGGPPRVQERVFATVPGDGMPLTGDEFRIIGTLHVVLNKDKDTGKIETVYTMDVKSAEPL
jgi:hypothetical protein